MSKEFRKESSGCVTNKPTPTLCFPKKINKYVKEPACETRDLCDFDKSLLKEPNAEIIVRDDKRKEYKITNARTEYVCNENNSSYNVDEDGNPTTVFPASGVVEAGTITKSTFDYAEVDSIKHEVAVEALQLAKANSQCRFYNYKTEYVCPTWYMKAEKTKQGDVTVVNKTFSKTAQTGYDMYNNSGDNGVLKAKEIEYLLPYPRPVEGKDFSIQSVLDKASYDQEVADGNIPSTGTIQNFMDCQGAELARSMSTCTYGNVASSGKCKRTNGLDDNESIAEDATLEANSFIEQADQTTLTKDCGKGSLTPYVNTDPNGYTPEQRAISDVWDEADVYLQANVICTYGNDKYTAVCPSSVAITETGNFTRIWETGFINADANQIYVVPSDIPIVAGNSYDTLIPPNGKTPVLEDGGYLISGGDRNLRMIKISESDYLSREEATTDGSYRSYVRNTRPGDADTDPVVDSYVVGDTVYYRCEKGKKSSAGNMVTTTLQWSDGMSPLIKYNGSEALSVTWGNGFGYQYTAFKFYNKDGVEVDQQQGTGENFTIQCSADKNATGYKIAATLGVNAFEGGVVVVDSETNITLNLSEENIQMTEGNASVAGTITFTGGISIPLDTEISWKDDSYYYYIYRGTGAIASYEQEVRTIILINEKNSVTVDANSFTESFDSSLTDAQRAIVKQRVNQEAYTQAWGTIGNPPTGTSITKFDEADVRNFAECYFKNEAGKEYCKITDIDYRTVNSFNVKPATGEVVRWPATFIKASGASLDPINWRNNGSPIPNGATTYTPDDKYIKLTYGEFSESVLRYEGQNIYIGQSDVNDEASLYAQTQTMCAWGNSALAMTNCSKIPSKSCGSSGYVNGTDPVVAPVSENSFTSYINKKEADDQAKAFQEATAVCICNDWVGGSGGSNVTSTIKGDCGDCKSCTVFA